MSAPYWGDLPAPKVYHARMSGDDFQDPSSRRQSLDQPQRKPNRASVQTNHTDAPTESTFSPNSPNRSSFGTQGLAPRPPSYQRGPPQESPAEGSDRKQRRSARASDEYEEPEFPAPPAVPEVPRGPPVSYRRPYPNSGPQYSYSASGAAKPPLPREAEPPAQQEDMEPDEYYNRRASGPPAPSQRPIEDVAARRDAAILTQQMAGQRRPSAGGAAERRKNMTKEEKRARMEAAEKRARQRAAVKAGETPVSPQVESHDRRPFGSQDEGRAPPMPVQPMPVPPMPREAPVQRQASARKAQPKIRTPEYANYGPGPGSQQPREVRPVEPQVESPVEPSIEPASGIPKRNLSFRERTARKDTRPPVEDAGPAARDLGASGGLPVARSGSNKLKKDPPGDPWYHQRMEAERRMPSVSKRPPPPDEHILPKVVPIPARDKELPPVPAVPAVPAVLEPKPPMDIARDRVPEPSGPGGTFGGIRRHATEPIYGREYASDEEYIPPVTRNKLARLTGEEPPLTFEEPQDAAFARRRLERQDSDSDSSHHHRLTGMLYKGKETYKPGEGLYKSPQWLNEVDKGTVGTLGGTLLDVSSDQTPTIDKNKPWWEDGGRKRSSSFATRPRKAEAFDGEYDDTNAPTRFKPPLFLKCGPLLRYCGMRQEKIPTRTQRNSAISEREIWRGTVMIVTNDADSSYEIVPMLRLFVQDIGLLPPPPHQVNGDLSPEYVDPIAGHPKLGRRGETLYVRPVEHLEEGKDLSRDETDEGLFETSRSPPDVPPPDGSSDLPGSFASRRRRMDMDGEKVQKYKDVRGFRLHAENGCTFWRFNVEIELREKQQRIAYRINRGPCMGFWVPARGQAMNMMFHSCNGFSSSVKPDEFSGPDPMWRDVLNTHQTQPFHVMIGGGDQIYNDSVGDECKLLDEWLDMRNHLHKRNAPFTPEMQNQLEQFYLERYCMWFSQGLFGLANSQIPMVNMYDDHDIFDGFGSYPHRDMNSAVFSGLGNVAFKYYMLFQHQSIVTETENLEPSWIVGIKPGPYITELSRSVYVSMGGKVALLAVDCRTERTEHDIVDDKSWEKIMNRLYAEMRRGQVEHLLVVLGVPIAYPRLVWLENILTSRLMDPVKALGKAGMFGKVLNNIDGGVEVLDDLNDHWTAKNHKHERSIIIEDLQDLAIDKSLRITLLSGDVHLAAVGQFYSNPKLGLAKHKDPRYMPNIISSAIVNTPPPDLMADVLNKRNKIHHFDKQTDENMIPMFQHGVDGKARNNKHLLPHRNWCAIRQWAPGSTPPPTPPMSTYERSPSPPSGGGGILRRLSKGRNSSNQGEATRGSVRGPRPPVSGGGGLFRSLSRRNSTSNGARPGVLTRTMSLGRGENQSRGFFGFGRRDSNKGRPDDGGINGQWGESDEEDSLGPPSPVRPRLRGGAGPDEFSEGDDSYFTVRPPPARAQTFDGPAMTGANEGPDPMRRPFHRTPTGLSTKQMRKPANHEVDLEGGLDICLNVEVNPKDPTGITVPYRLLVPKLFYEYKPGQDEIPAAEPTGFKRLMSFRKKPGTVKEKNREMGRERGDGYGEDSDEGTDDEFPGRGV